MAESDRGGQRDSDGTGLGTVPTILRFVAIVFVLVGFTGAYLNETSPLAVDTVYGVLFVSGVICAFASIYLAIFQANRDDS